MYDKLTETNDTSWIKLVKFQVPRQHQVLWGHRLDQKKIFEKGAKFLSLELIKSDPLTRSKIEDFDAILAYLAYLAEDFGSQRSDVLRANKNLLYGDFEGLFTSQNLLPGKKKLISSCKKKLLFFSTRRNFLQFSSCKKKIFRNSYGQIKPRNGDSFSFRKSSFDLLL